MTSSDSMRDEAKTVRLGCKSTCCRTWAVEQGEQLTRVAVVRLFLGERGRKEPWSRSGRKVGRSVVESTSWLAEFLIAQARRSRWGHPRGIEVEQAAGDDDAVAKAAKVAHGIHLMDGQKHWRSSPVLLIDRSPCWMNNTVCQYPKNPRGLDMDMECYLQRKTAAIRTLQTNSSCRTIDRLLTCSLLQ